MKRIGKNVIYSVMKQLSRIIIPLLLYPYIARTLGTESFGIYSFSEAVIEYFILFAALGIPTYAIREGARVRDDKEVIRSFSGEMLSLNCITTSIVFLCLIILINVVERLNDNRTILLILSANMLTAPFAREWLSSIYEDYRIITYRYIFFHILSLIFALLLVKSSNDVKLFAAVMVFASVGSNIVSCIYTCRYTRVCFGRVSALKRHIRPIIYLCGMSLAIKVYANSDIVMLGLFADNTEVGIYSLVSRIYMMIKALMNAAIMAIIPRLVYYLGNKEDEKFYQIINRIRELIYLIILPAAIGLMVISKEILVCIGGNEYESGYLALRMLGVSLLLAVFSCLYANAVLVPLRKEKAVTVIVIISALQNIILNLIFIPAWGMTGAAVTTVLSELTVMLLCREKLASVIHVCSKGIVWDSMIGGCVIFLCSLLTKMIFVEDFVRICVSIISSIIVYATYLILRKNAIIIDMLNAFKR